VLDLEINPAPFFFGGNMSNVNEVFAAIAAHKKKGVMIHKAMMEAYDFLSLKGYKKW